MFNIFIYSALLSTIIISSYEQDFPNINNFISKNIYDEKEDGKSKNSNYFNQNVFKYVDKILTDLQIQSESPRLSQDGGLVPMDGFEYIELEKDNEIIILKLESKILKIWYFKIIKRFLD